MSTLLTAIKSRLAELERTVVGVKRAYTDAPSSLPHADLPIFLNFTGPATFTKIGETLGEETRTFFARLYVKPILGGIDGEAEAAATEYLAAARDVLLSHPSMGKSVAGSPISFVERVEYLGDGGVMVMPFANENFVGSEFRVTITTIVPVTIAKFD
ncbi:MAG: hypothetical protein NTW69_06300 [Chloroflexi bacterium]|nr:hypothetical protein [Chloroflexota bacterium]